MITFPERECNCCFLDFAGKFTAHEDLKAMTFP